MFQEQQEFEDDMSDANGFDELFSSEFHINNDVINVHMSHLYNQLSNELLLIEFYVNSFTLSMILQLYLFSVIRRSQ